jgi:hypothetical protein
MWSLTSIRLILSAPLNWLLSKSLRRGKNEWLTLSVQEMCALRAVGHRHGSPYALHHYRTYDTDLKSNGGWALFFTGYKDDGEMASAIESTHPQATLPASSAVPEPSTPKRADEQRLSALIETMKSEEECKDLLRKEYFSWPDQRPPSQSKS